jgi:chromosome partitioning protein
MVITIGAEKGGVAKTRLATNIAAMAAAEGVDVVLLDTDKQGSAMSWVRIRNEEHVEPAIPVFALPANPARELADLASRYDLVVVDIGAQNYRTMLECALLSDLVLVPCGADQQEVESTLNVFDAIRGLDPRHSSGKVPAHVVLTRVSTNKEARSTADLREVFLNEGISVFAADLPQREAWKASGKTGRSVKELRGKDRSEKAVEEMTAVYKEIIKRASKKGA